MKPSISCGIVLLSDACEIFLAHATETSHWDILKGQMDPGEDARRTALREAHEESGLDLAPVAIDDLGVMPYRRDKSLHLFAARLGRDSVDPAACVCTSMFVRDACGRTLPEMDAFEWVPFPEIPRRCGVNLARVLGNLIAGGLADRLPIQRFDRRILQPAGTTS